MNRVLAGVLVLAAAIGAFVWFRRTEKAPSDATASPPEAQASVPQAGDPRAGAGVVPAIEPPSTRSEQATPPDPRAAAAAADAERERIGLREAEWVASWGNASKAELQQLIEKLTPQAREQRDSTFDEFAAQINRATTVWSGVDAEPDAVEREFARPPLIAASRLIERDKSTMRSRFQIVYVTAEEAPELADTERLLAWLAAREKVADH